MILFTKFFGISVLTAFTGSKNFHIVPVANKCSDSRFSMASNSYWMGCSKSKSWHERSLGTIEGISSCWCCKWNWWHSLVQISRLWHCWCSICYNGVSRYCGIYDD